MELKIGDIVRYKHNRHIYKGLFEVTTSYVGQGKTYHYAVTNNECDTEHYVNKDEIMLVCSADDRKDI
jgi:hypothetical protein